MKPLIVLLSVFAVSLLTTKFVRGNFELALSGRIAMAAMLVFTAVAHFVFTKGMSMMLPDIIPYKTEVVYLTGIIEIAAGIGLFIPNLRIVTAWLLIAFFILILPANIYAAVKHIDYQKGTYEGNGLSYLWFRVPLQILFIVGTYFSAIKTDEI
ncbi:DoxX family protein [Adhaeribacter aquaticus]|uniref:DoxX family protein n=1 Tax=Adhaeribacter aquaticus TaxID=299567 RepID=UPI00047B8BED|nr:membrane protein [Adhaeribacter aquaticus]